MRCAICDEEMTLDERFSDEYGQLYHCKCGFKLEKENGVVYPDQSDVDVEKQITWEKMEEYYG